MNVEQILKSDNVPLLGELYATYVERRLLTARLRRRDGQEPMDYVVRGMIEAALASLSVVSPLVALHAQIRLVQIIQDYRWQLVLDTREAGIGWDQIAAALGMTGDDPGAAARTWYVGELSKQKDLDIDSAERAAAVINDPVAHDDMPGGAPR